MFDFLIVGAGPAGCVLANRLSANPQISVCLLEAGPDYGPDQADWPADWLDAGAIPDSGDGWGYTSPRLESAESVGLPRTRAVGGSSAMNGCIWIRGSAADFDAWQIPGWDYQSLLPWFKKAETDPLGGAYHGSDGPVPVERVSAGEMTVIDSALVTSGAVYGLPAIEDFNAGPIQLPGMGPTPRNTSGGVRMNAAFTHLAAVRHRPNLTIRANSVVDNVTMSGDRVTGVTTSTGEVLEARETVLTSGAYGSPAILLRSGIGPAAHLASLGIPIKVDLPGVGGNLQDHPKIDGCMEALIASDQTPHRPSFQQVMATVRSHQIDHEIDLHIYQGQSFNGELKRWIFWATISLQRALSIGSLRLTGANPDDPLLIDHHWLSVAPDLETMCDGVEVLNELVKTPPIRDMVSVIPEKSVQWSNRDELRQRVRRQVGTTYHPSGTCKMGGAADTTAVVDNHCRVIGVKGLRVIDPSIFPVIPRNNVHFPIIASAEKMAAELLIE